MFSLLLKDLISDLYSLGAHVILLFFVMWRLKWNIRNSDKETAKHKYEPQHDKTNKTACALSEDSDQPGHPPSLIRVFADRMKKGWADAQAHLSLRWAHSHFVGFA